MHKLEKSQLDELEKRMAGEVVEAEKGQRKLSLQNIFSAGAQVLDKIPHQYVTSRSTKHQRRREQDEKTAPIEFTLFAPYNKRAAVRGDFSDWKDVELTKSEDGYFRTTLDLP